MIKFFDIYGQDKKDIKKYLNSFSKVAKNTSFINGESVSIFEKKFAKYCDVKYAVSCNSGSDALFLSLKALNLKNGSEVILPAQTYCSTVFAVIRAGLKPVLVDIQKNNPTICTDALKRKITTKTKAIIIVHLYGECCNIKEIKKIINKKKIYLIEDAAQAHGTYDYSYGRKGKRAGSIGDLGCFSFYPGKNLGAYGDGGAITTSSRKLFLKLSKLKNLGGVKKYQHDLVGYNSRLDSIQAEILIYKLKQLDINNKKRQKIAKFYNDNLKNKNIYKLNYSQGCVYHQYVILSKKEKKIKTMLKKYEIPFGKHYPQPIHKLKAVKNYFNKESYKNAEINARYGLSLPIDPNLKKKNLITICNVINSI